MTPFGKLQITLSRCLVKTTLKSPVKQKKRIPEGSNHSDDFDFKRANQGATSRLSAALKTRKSEGSLVKRNYDDLDS